MPSPWEKLLQRPHPAGHFVQFYEADERALTNNVGQYLWEGLRRGDGVLVIASADHRKLFFQHLESLGAQIPALLASRQLVCWDAEQTLAEFMVNGQPDWTRFEAAIRAAINQVHPLPHAEGLRAYGEMVGILWKSRQFAAAIRLEQLWNKLLEQSAFSLYCAYAIDIFGKEFELSNLEGVLCTHTHVLPAPSDVDMETALYRSMEEILGPEGDKLRILISASCRPSWAVMPSAANIVLWLRKNLPEQAENIMQRARHHYHVLSQAAAS